MTKMKHAIIILFLFTTPAQADWKDTVWKGFFVAAGFVSGFVVHELSHELTARAYGEKLRWEGLSWVCEYPCENIDNIALAGNLGTAIVGEALLHLPDKYRYTPFVDGMQVFNTLNPIGYAIQDSLTTGGYQDYRYVDNRIQVAIAIHAATIGYRQFSERAWNFVVTQRGVQVLARF